MSDAVRQAFERFVRSKYGTPTGTFSRWGDDERYALDWVQSRWEGWQAALAQQSPPEPFRECLACSSPSHCERRKHCSIEHAKSFGLTAEPPPLTDAEPVARQWPFERSPGAVAAEVYNALAYFNGDMIAALRNVFIERGERLRHPPAREVPQHTRDADWILAMGHALGLNSGFHVPIVPEVEPFRRLFAALRAKGGDK